jgi:hypothetical protein
LQSFLPLFRVGQKIEKPEQTSEYKNNYGNNNSSDNYQQPDNRGRLVWARAGSRNSHQILVEQILGRVLRVGSIIAGNVRRSDTKGEIDCNDCVSIINRDMLNRSIFAPEVKQLVGREEGVCIVNRNVRLISTYRNENQRNESRHVISLHHDNAEGVADCMIERKVALDTSEIRTVRWNQRIIARDQIIDVTFSLGQAWQRVRGSHGNNKEKREQEDSQDSFGHLAIPQESNRLFTVSRATVNLTEPRGLRLKRISPRVAAQIELASV